MDLKTVSLKDYSSLRVGGEGKLALVTTLDELKEAVAYGKSEGLSIHVIGGGTNTYFAEDLSSFLFIKLDFKGVVHTEKDNEVLLTSQASEVWDDIVSLCVDKGWWGVENLSYIPGTVGGAPVQNIGAYGMELNESFVSLQAFNVEALQVETFDREKCQFGYRDSIFKFQKGKYIILEVTLKLLKTAAPTLHYKPLDSLQGKKDLTIKDIRELVIATRTSKLPDWKEYPNAGSFFKNPYIDLGTAEIIRGTNEDIPLIQVPQGYKIPAAWLIEHVAEMKDVRRGDLGTWPKQPLVIVNYGSASADDIDALAQEITEKVNKKIGIILEQEVNRVG